VTANSSIAELLERLSLDQKVALLAGVDTWHTASFADPPVSAMRMSDGPAGVRGTTWNGPASAAVPCGTALAATFDPDLVAEVGRELAREMDAKGAHLLLGPTINLARTPIGGRNFEMMGEDPHLTGEIAVAYVDGVQAPSPDGAPHGVCVKHLVGNDSEHERMTISVEAAESVLREVYLAPFEAVVRRARPAALMSGYNRLDGT
jgi:beta-glucosidase